MYLVTTGSVWRLLTVWLYCSLVLLQLADGYFQSSASMYGTNNHPTLHPHHHVSHVFRQQLKTFLFRCLYPNVLIWHLNCFAFDIFHISQSWTRGPRNNWSWLDCTHLSHAELSWLSGSSGTVCCAKRPACTICCRTNVTYRWQTVCAMPRLLKLNCSQPEQEISKFLSLQLFSILWLGPVLYWLTIVYQLYQSSRWLLCDINHF